MVIIRIEGIGFGQVDPAVLRHLKEQALPVAVSAISELNLLPDQVTVLTPADLEPLNPARLFVTMHGLTRQFCSANPGLQICAEVVCDQILLILTEASLPYMQVTVHPVEQRTYDDPSFDWVHPGHLAVSERAGVARLLRRMATEAGRRRDSADSSDWTTVFWEQYAARLIRRAEVLESVMAQPAARPS